MENDITGKEKKLAAILLVIFTCIPAILIVWFWPDRLPQPKEFTKPLYYPTPFHVRLAGICDTISFEEAKKMLIPNIDTALIKKHLKTNNLAADSLKNDTVKDSPRVINGNIEITINTCCENTDSSNAKIEVIYLPKSKCIVVKDESKFLHINTILLILIAMAGFLGNMIHVATSLTTFVGNKKFVRSWLLWYCVRPFTGAALAIGVYFVFRGGFLNMSDDSTNINLYGIMTVSVLTGLFTDRATQKLKEVFEVLFKPKEERANPLDGKPTITSITPLQITTGIENSITLAGENLTAGKLSATINDENISINDIREKSAAIKYTIPDTQKDKTTFNLVIKDEEGKAIPGGTATLTLKKDGETGDGTNTGAVNDETGDDDNDTSNTEQGAQE